MPACAIGLSCRRCPSSISGCLPTDVIHKDDDIGISIETFDDGVEALLASSIPYFELYLNIGINFHYLRVIFNSQGNCVVICELVVEIALDEASFATPRFTHYYRLEDQRFLCHIHYKPNEHPKSGSSLLSYRFLGLAVLLTFVHPPHSFPLLPDALSLNILLSKQASSVLLAVFPFTLVNSPISEGELAKTLFLVIFVLSLIQPAV